jgi:hypothetical protein
MDGRYARLNISCRKSTPPAFRLAAFLNTLMTSTKDAQANSSIISMMHSLAPEYLELGAAGVIDEPATLRAAVAGPAKAIEQRVACCGHYCFFGINLYPKDAKHAQLSNVDGYSGCPRAA